MNLFFKILFFSCLMPGGFSAANTDGSSRFKSFDDFWGDGIFQEVGQTNREIYFGRFQAEGRCVLARGFDLYFDARDNRLYKVFLNGEESDGFIGVNLGRNKIDSCWVDGRVGWSESTWDGRRSFKQVIVLEQTGLFCRKTGRIKSRLEQEIEITVKGVIWSEKAQGSRNEEVSCHFILQNENSAKTLHAPKNYSK